jgi:hypothetical protein
MWCRAASFNESDLLRSSFFKQLAINDESLTRTRFVEDGEEYVCL